MGNSFLLLPISHNHVDDIDLVYSTIHVNALWPNLVLLKQWGRGAWGGGG